MWTDDWVGLPYEKKGKGPNAYDCIGLFRAVIKTRMGIDIPDPDCTAEEAIQSGLLSKYRRDLKSVDKAEEGDAVLVRSARMGIHMGYAISHRDMLHTLPNVGSIVTEFTGIRFKDQIMGIYRLA